MATQRKLLEGVAALRRVKDWDYINSHKTFVNPVPAMKEYCGKIVTVVDSIIPFELASQMDSCGIYSIFEDEGRFMWCADWLEEVSDEELENEHI